MNDELWEAIIHNDASYDGTFFYGVTTTGIFCRPSCKSRNPNIEHVRIFHSAAEAINERFRPCKRCKPDGKEGPDVEWVQQIADYIEAHYREPLTLPLLAEKLHASPFHLHRTFKRLRGVTPIEYMQQLRIREAKGLLATSMMPVTEVAQHVGYTNAAHFSTLFHKKAGSSPSDYRLAHATERKEADANADDPR